MNRLMSACLLLAAGCSAVAPSLPSPVPPRVAGAAERGRLAPETPLAFTLGLTLRDRAGLAALHASGAGLTPAGFGERFGPTGAAYAHVVAWLRAHGLTVEEMASHASLHVSGRAADIEVALGTELHQYADARGTFFAPTALRPDASIVPTLAGALGLDNAALFLPRHQPVQPQFSGGSADPGDLRALYNAPPMTGELGDGETIAILGAGNPPDPAMDVDGFILKFTLPVPNRKGQYAQVFLGGPNRDSAALANNEYSENLLDVDMALNMAPHADIIHVLTATNGGLFADGIDFIVNNIPQAHQVSVSYGTCEALAAGSALVLDQLFAQAKAQGQQWFFASGDNGSNGCEKGPGNKVPAVGWPTSSPYVISVGGTQLTLDAMSNVTGEIAWSAGGGGQSEILGKPAYQVAQAGDTRPRTPADGVRDVVDIAALSGPPGINYYGQGQQQSAEGTSFATPMWAGIFALIDQARGGQGISNGAERLYQLGATSGMGFKDITSGSNGSDGTNGVSGAPGYAAGPGWDFATGWGAPNIQQLISQW
jgi:kumamolisin